MTNIKNVVWFKRDLRIYDHEPLATAARSGLVIPLYVIEPDLWQQPDTSWRHWHFIHDSLVDLNHALNKLGGKLIIRIGRLIETLNDLKHTLGSFNLWSHEETGNAWTFQRDIQVAKWCHEHQITWIEFPSNGVFRGLKSRNTWSLIREKRMAKPIIAPPEHIAFAAEVISAPLPAKTHPMFGKIPPGCRTQIGGRTSGLNVLHSFLNERASHYLANISKPGISARTCSRLSPHIAYGTLSVREIEHVTNKKLLYLKSQPNQEYQCRNLTAFLSRLVWRCHFVQKLEQQPEIETHCMHPVFEGMREPHFRQDFFEAWQTGHTGYPIVDACMRSLIHTGWITFRMRAMLVSFASYNLWLDWRQTAPYLATLFTDYEPGIHYAQFQMQSGVTGINTTRIYNPIKQSMDQDPKGQFIRRFVPELHDIPDAFIHTPWLYTNTSTYYPSPIVDHDTAIKHARNELAERFQHPDFKVNANRVRQKLASRKRSPRKKIAAKKNPQQLSLDFE